MDRRQSVSFDPGASSKAHGQSFPAIGYERGSTLVTSNPPFDEWTKVSGSERLTGALFDRLTHDVHILEMNGESYRLKQSRSGQYTKTR